VNERTLQTSILVDKMQNIRLFFWAARFQTFDHYLVTRHHHHQDCVLTGQTLAANRQYGVLPLANLAGSGSVCLSIWLFGRLWSRFIALGQVRMVHVLQI